MEHAVGIAPGRLDFLGGVADYSGSLVLETPIAATTRVEILALAEGVLRLRSAAQESVFEIPLRELHAHLDDSAPVWRHFLRDKGAPHWTKYVLGCFWLFALEQDWWPSSGLAIHIDSKVPTSMGVSSSAALEVATLRALETLSSQTFSGTALAHLAQRAENEAVGAPCGLMDQLTVAHGRHGELLPILCRPDILHPPLPLPLGVIVVGWPSGVKHAVADAPYATARAAAFMGKKMLETHFGQAVAFLTEFIPAEVIDLSEEVLPVRISGAEFLERFGGVDDPLTQIESERIYPLRSGTFFPIQENARCEKAVDHLHVGGEAELRLVGELMFQSHEGYSSIGLGCLETDAMVEVIRELGPANGFYGARVSGGGSGGTVVVLARKEAIEEIRKFNSFVQTIVR